MLKRQKRRLYLRIKSSSSTPQSFLSKYRRVSNQVRAKMRLDTKRFTESLCSNFHKDSKRFWNWANSSKGRRDPIPALKIDTDDSVKA